MVIHHGGAIHAAARRLGVSHDAILDFSASINPLGPAPAVRDAIMDALDRIVHYPDPYSSELRAALAERWNVEPEAILTGNGATDLLHFVARCWPQPQVTLVAPTFSEFHRAWPDARLVPAHAQWPQSGFLAVTNPVNPTGDLLAIAHRDGPTLVDESFLDFTDHPSCSHATFRLRSLTKFYAIPGLRVGALIGPPDVIRGLLRVREPWQVNALAEAATLAALNDRGHAQRTVDFVRSESRYLADALDQLPCVRARPPAANYVFATLGYSAARLCEFLFDRGILVRNCAGWPGINGEAVRVAVRTRAENERLLACWRTFPCD